MLSALKKVREERRRAAAEGEPAAAAEAGLAAVAEAGSMAAAEAEPAAEVRSPPLIERVEDVFIHDRLSVRLRIAQDPSGTLFQDAGHGATVWDSSIVLSRYISRHAGIRGRLAAADGGVRGCELGCGCGLAGLTAFVLGCDMLLTDMRAVLPIVELNIEKNRRAVGTALAMAMCNSSGADNDAERLKSSITMARAPRAAVLDWTDRAAANAFLVVDGDADDGGEEEVPREVPFEVILGADLMYDKRLAVPLATTIARLASPTSFILIAHEFRKQAVDDAFFSAFRDNGLSFEQMNDTGLWEEDIALYTIKLEKVS
jgi:predicted nicotinamide N-methyase